MSFKKKLLFSFIKKALKHKKPKRYVGGILGAIMVFILLFSVAAIIFIGYGINQVNNLVTKETNIDLLALESLISENKIELSEEQKTLVTPLVNSLVDIDNLVSEEAKTITNQMLNVLTLSQLEMLKQRRQEIAEEAGISNAISIQGAYEMLAKYSGLSLEQVKEVFSGIQRWWELKDPTNKAPENLLEQL